ncbi:nodulation protein NoeA [soil metagenome]
MTRTGYEPASFRDPDSAVFHADGQVLRGLSAAGARDGNRLVATQCCHRLVEEGRLVATEVHDADAPPSPRGHPWSLVLRHERVPVISYPFEWPFAMLREAAVCHLEVLLAALDEGMSTKDGTAYNVAFRGTRPVFIDLGSFEPTSGPWPGYRQFCQTFLFPLLIQAHLRIPYQGLLRGHVDGLEPAHVRGMFGGLRRLRRGVFLHVLLQSAAERRVTTSTEKMKRELGGAGFSSELAKATVTKLLKLVRRLEVKRSRSVWSDYRATCSYTDDDAAANAAFVEAALEERATAGDLRCVLDLGANDGAYSVLAARYSEQVVAVDGDEMVIDQLFRRLQADGITNVLPLVMDLADPSPGLGWRHRERAPFLARVRPEVVLSLALVHHLAISANIPLPEMVDWLRSFDARLVVEFVHPDDPMVERLLANKPAGLFDDYRTESFEELLAARFAIARRELLPGGTRSLYVADPA